MLKRIFNLNGWITGKTFEPENGYQDRVDALNQEADKLNVNVEALKIERDDLVSGNAQILKDKIAQLDSLIQEEHKIKQRIIEGAAEAQAKEKAADEQLLKLSQDRQNHANSVLLMKQTLQEKEEYLVSREDSLSKLESQLKSLKESIDQENNDLTARRNAIDNEIKNLEAQRLEIASLNNEVYAGRMEVQQRENQLELKKKEYMVNNAAFVKAQQDFEDMKNSTYAQAAQTEADKEDIEKKIEANKNLILENARIQVDANQKLEALKTENSKNLDMIANLTKLKEQLIAQGEQNVIKNP